LNIELRVGYLLNDDENYYQSETFEDKIKALMPNMTDTDLKRSTEQVAYMCKCTNCPSNQGTGEKRTVFCNLGKNPLIQEKKGCLCRDCPLTKMISLRWDYYCMQGSSLRLSNSEKASNTVIPLKGGYD
jgi:hypothetical protein